MAKIDGVEITVERLKRFHPLTLISEKHLDKVLDGAAIVRLAKGQFLFRKNPAPETSYFLMEGEVEVRESFENRSVIDANGSQARFPLEELCKGGASVKAQKDTMVLTLKRDGIDQMMASSDDGGFDVVL